MQRRGHARRVFAGSNSAYGFSSFYGDLIRPDANRVFVVKGGPGVGKSTFMRRIAEDLLANGFDVDLLQCSADNDSIDGFDVPALGVTMVDGTAPHVLDPGYPGAVDEIVNLGVYWDETAMAASRGDVVRLTEANRACYPHAYAALKAAKVYLGDIERHVARSRALDVPGLNALAADLTSEILRDLERRPRQGRVRRLFASAITPDGFRNYFDTVFHPLEKRYVVRGHWGTGKSVLVRRILDALLDYGCDVEVFHCALDPERIEHLVVPDLRIGVITSALPHTYEPRSDDVLVDTAQCVNADALAAVGEDINVSREMYGRSMEIAIAWLARAKQIHDRLEVAYAGHMDFDAVDELRGEILARIYGIAHREGLLDRTAAAAEVAGDGAAAAPAAGEAARAARGGDD